MIKRLIKSVDLTIRPSRKQATVRLAIGGYINTSIVIAQGLLLTPLYLYFIGAHTYGLWLASGGILGMLGLMNFGVSGLVLQRIAKAYAQMDLSLARAYYINGAAIYLGICLLYGLVGWVASIWIPEVLDVTGENAELLRKCFQVAVSAMVIGTFNEFLRSFSHALLRPMVSMVSMAAGRILGICVTVWMLFNDFGLWSIPVGLLISEGFIFAINLAYSIGLSRKLPTILSLNQNIIKEFMRTSPVLLTARVGDTVSREADPLLITIFVGPELTTAYMVTRRAADIVFRLLSVIVASTMSSFSHLAGCDDNKKTGGMALKLLTLNFSIGAIGFATYAGTNHAFVSMWVGESFALNQEIILFIALGFFARTFRGLLVQILYGLGDFVYPSIVVLLAGIARIALATWLLSMLDIIGIPIAFTLACFISIVPLGLRLINQLTMRICLPSIARLLFSAAILYSVNSAVIQLDFDINSWGIFLLYLLIIMTSTSILFISMNLSRFRDIYKSIFP